MTHARIRSYGNRSIIANCERENTDDRSFLLVVNVTEPRGRAFEMFPFLPALKMLCRCVCVCGVCGTVFPTQNGKRSHQQPRNACPLSVFQFHRQMFPRGTRLYCWVLVLERPKRNNRNLGRNANWKIPPQNMKLYIVQEKRYCLSISSRRGKHDKTTKQILLWYRTFWKG